MARNALSRYGYPSNKSLRRQAGAIADASVPTVKATSAPYKAQHQAVSGFLAAVLDALGNSSGEVADAYYSASAGQDALNAAAAQRLSALGLGDYSAGVQAAQGARGDSAAAQLLSQGAAARNYIALQPGVATGYGQTQNAAINRALHDALTQRSTARSQAFVNALQTVQQNALQRADFMAGRQDAASSLAMQRAQMAQSQAQFNAQQAFNQQQLAEQHWQFSQSQKQDWNKFLLSQDGSGSKKQTAWSRLTPGQQQQQLADIADSVHDAKFGVPNKNYGKPLPGGGTDTRKWTLAPRAKKPEQVYQDLRAHGYSQRAILQTFQRTYTRETFAYFMAKNFPKIYNKLWGKTVTTPPGYQH